MKKTFLKISSYFLNTKNKHSKLELFSNWLVILLPISLMTILMIWAANSEGKSEEELRKTMSSAYIGIVEIIWILLFVWFVIYKIYKRVLKIHKKTSEKALWKKRFRKEKWEQN